LNKENPTIPGETAAHIPETTPRSSIFIMERRRVEPVSFNATAPFCVKRMDTLRAAHP